MQQFGLLNWVILCVYLTGMVLVGLWFSRGLKTTEEFFLAGRKMPWLVVGMSMFASLTSASTFMGVPGIAFSDNVAIFFGVLVSPIAAPIIVWLFYPHYQRLNATTSYEYILYRFGMTAKVVTSGLFILARLGWLGVVIYAPALALNIATGMNIHLSIFMMTILATVYTALGGLRADLWTDVSQFIILVGGAVWAAVSLVNNVPDGIVGIFTVAQQSGKLSVFGRPDFFAMSAISAAFGYFFIFLQDYGVDQITVQRLLAVGNFRGIAKSVFFNSISDVAVNGLLLFIGLGLFAFFAQNPDKLPTKGDTAFSYYIANYLPNGVSGLIITGIFAAAMSSMDSGINSLATVIVNDFVKPFKKKQLNESQLVSLARILTVVLGGFGLITAYIAGKFGSIVEAWNSFVSLFSAPVLAIFMLGMLTKKANFAGWIVGALFATGIMAYLDYFTAMHWIYNFPISFGVTFIVGYFASYLFKTGNSN